MSSNIPEAMLRAGAAAAQDAEAGRQKEATALAQKAEGMGVASDAIATEDEVSRFESEGNTAAAQASAAVARHERKQHEAADAKVDDRDRSAMEAGE